MTASGSIESSKIKSGGVEEALPEGVKEGEGERERERGREEVETKSAITAT